MILEYVADVRTIAALKRQKSFYRRLSLINEKVNAAREKQNALTAHDDPIATQLTVQFATPCRNLMRDKV